MYPKRPVSQESRDKRPNFAKRALIFGLSGPPPEPVWARITGAPGSAARGSFRLCEPPPINEAGPIPLPTMPQRDYILRLIEQAMQVIAQITLQREMGQNDLAVQSVIDALEKLFGLTVAELGSLDTDQLFAQLTREENPENARDKCLIFAALNTQAGLAYEAKDLPALAQPAFHLALVFILRALNSYPREGLPPFSPEVRDLLYRLEDFELPESTMDALEIYQARLVKTGA